MKEEDPKLQVHSSPTRCPYCHDDVSQAEFDAAKVCVDCLARHHADCWQGACAACSSTRVLGDATLAAATMTPQLLEARLTGDYERIKRVANRASIVLFALYVPLMFVGMLVTELMGLMQSPTPPWPVWPGLVTGLLLALLLIPLPFLNAYDGWKRNQRDPTCGAIAAACIALSWCTGGLSGMAYYLRWGWRPLDDDGPPPPQRPPAK